MSQPTERLPRAAETCYDGLATATSSIDVEYTALVGRAKKNNCSTPDDLVTVYGLVPSSKSCLFGLKRGAKSMISSFFKIQKFTTTPQFFSRAPRIKEMFSVYCLTISIRNVVKLTFIALSIYPPFACR